MADVWIQAVGTGAGYEHYRNTMARSRSLQELVPQLTPRERARLEDVYRDGECHIWGVVPGEDDTGRRKWERLAIGSRVLFSWDRKIQSVASVKYRTENPSLAEYLWDFDSDGQVWQYIYFLDEPRSLSIPFPEFNRVVGYDESFYAQTLIKMRDEAGKRAEAYVADVIPEPEDAEPDEEDFRVAVRELERLDELDAERKANARVEQGFIRNYWFGGQDQADCTLCGQTLPVGLLVAAHVKRRSACTFQEKLDYRNNTMPVCALGCDELFERGYLLVRGGRVVTHPELPTTDAVRRYQARVADRELGHWSSESAPYFRWHQHFHTGTR